MKFDVKNWLLESEIQRGLRVSGLWHVVYHEGIRGHHILFDKDTISAVEGHSEAESLRTPSDELETAVMKVLRQPTLAAVKTSLKGYDPKVKSDLFRLYKRALRRYSDARALKLN